VKKFLFCLILFIISNNIFVFIYGIYAYCKASDYENKQQENYILDSALTLALHAHEDNILLPEIEKEFRLKGIGAGFVLKKLDTGKIYIKVYIKERNKAAYREYLKDTAVPLPARAAPPITAVSASAPVPATITASALQTPHIAASPSPTVIAVPTFTLIK